MKKGFNLLLVICIFILANSQKINYLITSMDWDSWADQETNKIRFNFTYETNDEMNINTEFTLELKNEDLIYLQKNEYPGKIEARCFIERENSETRRLSASFLINKENQKQKITLNKRKLQTDSEEKGYCLFDIPILT